MRGNDRRPIFFSTEDRLHFLKCLGEARAKRGCDIHAFVLMPNHVHILATPRVDHAASLAMQDVGRAYVSNLNKLHGRTGALYEGRFKSSLVETTRYFLACMRYIEMNPVRARLAPNPTSFEWSSHGQNITGEPGGLIAPHAEYLNLGRTAQERARAYGRLFDEPEDEEELTAIRCGVAQGKALGTETYCRGLEKLLGRSVAFVPRGRPGS
ncbi:MAG TPA: transposase [Usitatibacter sp.]|nr:transposase [Usitatibacter sp.]